jgi:hypothetical protein
MLPGDTGAKSDPDALPDVPDDLLHEVRPAELRIHVESIMVSPRAARG